MGEMVAENMVRWLKVEKRWGGKAELWRERVRACLSACEGERERERERARERTGTYVVKSICMYYFFLFVRMDCFTISKDGELAKQPLSDLMT